ncbi:MAG: hypothetical protein AAB354_16035 [candidate division KSB1 bacterium]
MISQTEHDLFESVKTLPAERYAEVREFINLLKQNNELVVKAMAWISESLPDRYCAGEPRFEVRTLKWRVPIVISYSSGNGGEVGELWFDGRTRELDGHTALEEIRARGLKVAQGFQHAA